MSKTTINQNVTSLKVRTTTFLSLAFLLCTIFSFAQLKVNPNTIFTANNVVSSKEEANVFDSSVLGDSEVVLNGSNQYLETADQTSLPTLRVANGNELTIKTELRLRGDLALESGVLKLEKPLHIEGKLILENDALIFNDHFIIYENRFVFHKDFTSATTLEIFSSAPILIVETRIELSVLVYASNEKITSINECIKTQFKASPFSPPPEVIQIT